MDITIPAWAAYILIGAKFAVYAVSLYMFVRLVARREIALAQPAEAKPDEEDEADQILKLPPLPTHDTRYEINVNFSGNPIGRAEFEAELSKTLARAMKGTAS